MTNQSEMDTVVFKVERTQIRAVARGQYITSEQKVFFSK